MKLLLFVCLSRWCTPGLPEYFCLAIWFSMAEPLLLCAVWTIVCGLYKERFKSRSEPAPGSEFHPRDESEKIIVDFWDLLGAIKR